MNIEMDERDRAILQQRQALLDARPAGCIAQGDFLRMPDGSSRRVAHNWGTDVGVQPTHGPDSGLDDQSFYLSEGCCIFSGALDYIIPMKEIVPTDETREGGVWFFHHDYAMADGGVAARARFRVFEVKSLSDPEIAYRALDAQRGVTA